MRQLELDFDVYEWPVDELPPVGSWKSKVKLINDSEWDKLLLPVDQTPKEEICTGPLSSPVEK